VVYWYLVGYFIKQVGIGGLFYDFGERGDIAKFLTGHPVYDCILVSSLSLASRISFLLYLVEFFFLISFND